MILQWWLIKVVEEMSEIWENVCTAPVDYMTPSNENSKDTLNSKFNLMWHYVFSITSMKVCHDSK